jgi:hypothetical protein
MLPDRRARVQARPGIIHDRRSSQCRSSMDGPMAVPRAQPVRLSAAQRHRLKKIARGHKSPHRDRLRAQIVLDAAAGHANAAIARRLGVTADTARKWRGRFASDAFDGPGRPETRRPPASVHPGPAGPGQGPGLRAARSQRGAAVAVERRRGGRRGGHRRSGRCHQRRHRAPLATRRRAQTVAVPLVDRRTGTGLRRSRRCRAGPLRRKLRRRATRRRRLRAVRG